jgi:hypothetical protein
MTAADLGGANADQAVVVAANTVDTIHQFDRGGVSAAADDLENVIHDLGNPGGLTTSVRNLRRRHGVKSDAASRFRLTSGGSTRNSTATWKKRMAMGLQARSFG